MLDRITAQRPIECLPYGESEFALAQAAQADGNCEAAATGGRCCGSRSREGHCRNEGSGHLRLQAVRGLGPRPHATASAAATNAGAVLLGNRSSRTCVWYRHQEFFGAISPMGARSRPRWSSGGSSGGRRRRAGVRRNRHRYRRFDPPAAQLRHRRAKPTFGLVSKAGVFPLIWSMDHVGADQLRTPHSCSPDRRPRRR